MGSKRRSSGFLNKKFRVITVTVMMTACSSFLQTAKKGSPTRQDTQAIS